MYKSYYCTAILQPSTIKLSCPSQDPMAFDKVTLMKASVECQTDKVIAMSKEDYDKVVFDVSGL